MPKLIIKKKPAPVEPTVEERLLKAEEAYFETGVPIIDDAEYDALAEVAAREGAAPARPVGFRPMGEKQVVLPFPMPSLEKIKPGERRLADWLGAKSSNGYVISDKLDGVSALWCSSIVAGGKAAGPSRLFQRGDQQVGVEITQYTPYVSGLAELPVGAAVRGEIVLRRSEGVVSPADRNIVNGVLHRGDPDVAVSTLPGKLVFVGYEVLSPRMARSVQMKWMAARGFEVAHHQIITDGALTQEFLIDLLKRRRAEGLYPIDGVVVGRGGVPPAVSADMKYPVDCVAFKMPMADQMAETVVRDVEWNLTRMGYFVPRVSVEPVEIGGVTISWVTGHNAQWLRERGIGVGARVVIRRSGDVIPIIDAVLEAAEELAEPSDPWKMEGVHAVPVEASSVEERGGTARHLDYMMTQLGVKQFGPARLEAMKEAGVEDFAHMCQLEDSVWADVLGKGIGPKLRSAVLAAAAAANRRQKLACYPWPTEMTVGTTRIIAAEEMLESGRREKPDGFSAGAWQRYLEELPLAEKWCKAQFGSIQEVVRVAAAAGSTLKAKKAAVAAAKGVICMTGFRDAALQERLEAAGYAVAAFSGKTTILLVKDAGENNKKIQEAKEKGLRIVSKADAEEKLLE
jgi:NAD-dependent DNA ligase